MFSYFDGEEIINSENNDVVGDGATDNNSGVAGTQSNITVNTDSAGSNSTDSSVNGNTGVTSILFIVFHRKN